MAEAKPTLLTETARAKVNLFLHVRGRRADGYHFLESLVVFPDFGDRVTAEEGPGLSLSLEGGFAVGLDAGAGNLVLKAAAALAERLGEGRGARPGAALLLEKNLPVAAGLGGGSADAAAALRLLSRLWPGGDAAELAALAPRLGADVPVCLSARSQMMSGVGEVLSPAAPHPAFWLVLVNPMQALSTAEVFGAQEQTDHPAGPPAPPRFRDLPDFVAWLKTQRNDLEAPACRLRPVIETVLGALGSDPACLLQRMSGSGASCFGLYGSEAAALGAAERLSANAPDWWVAAAPVAAHDGQEP